MSELEKKIVASYAKAMESLSDEAKGELIRLLSQPSKRNEENIEKEFWETFGSWPSNKSAEEIIAEIRGARHFRDKDLSF